MYRQTTQGITITVEPSYLDDQSSPGDNHYVWAYHVRIENGSDAAVRLRSRYWRIADSAGRVQEVHGQGVVGQQPELAPGEAFEYTSGTPLSSPSGVMLGRYRMEDDAGRSFEVEIPAFSLDSPYQKGRPN